MGLACNTQRCQSVSIKEANLEGCICIPTAAKALVLFAHGSGSGADSLRNQLVARILNQSGIATLLVDLLTIEEKEIDNRTGHLRFDIKLLSSRVESITHWLIGNPETQHLALGYSGSSTGAAAAIIAATKFYGRVKAIVARGGRLDFAEDQLPEIRAPTLLIVGGSDEEVLKINKRAFEEMRGVANKDLLVIPGAGHVFAEHGRMEIVARETATWFDSFLSDSGKMFRSDYSLRVPRRFLSISEIKSRVALRLRFKDRASAGKILAKMLDITNSERTIVIGIARGGVVVGDMIAKKLSCDFDIIIPRRLRDPANSEGSVGAVMQDGSVYLDKELVNSCGVSEPYIQFEIAEQKKEIDRRMEIYRPKNARYCIENRRVILVDDGSATGATLAVAARWVRRHQPKHLLIAVPVISHRAFEVLNDESDRVEFIRSPSKFHAVENYYHDFQAVADEEIIGIMGLRTSPTL